MNRVTAIHRINDTTVEMLIYGYIGTDDEDAMTASGIVQDLKWLESEFPNINVRINCYGGSIFEGLAIYNAIKNSKSNVETFIDGVAASMGSVIAIAGKKVHMSTVAMLMTHKSSGLAVGSADNLRNTAQMMESLEAVICTIYAGKTGLTPEAAKAKYLTGDDKWMTAQQARDDKLIDSIYDSQEAIAIPTNVTDVQKVMAIYNKHLQTTNDYTMKQIILTAAQLAVLSLPENADATMVVNAIGNLNNKVADLTNQLSTANAAKQAAETALATVKEQTEAAQVETLLDTALNVDNKITAAGKATLAVQFKGKPVELKAVLDLMSPIMNITSTIVNGDDRLKELAAKTYSDLDKEGLLEELKAKSLDAFKNKFKAEFGREYTGK